MISRRLALAAAVCVPTATTAWAQQVTVRPWSATTTTITNQQGVGPTGALGDSKLADPKLADPKLADPRLKEWSPQDIELAQARCTVLLKGLDVVAVPETPWRDGECGTAAPMKLISIGKKGQQVAFSPPVTLTCDVIAAMHKWVQADLQPLARKHLGSPLVRIDTMSSYSCRNAYGRAKNRLSEHGRANALDIAAFVTGTQTAQVVADWGLTARDIAAAAKGVDPAKPQEKPEHKPATAIGTAPALKGPLHVDPGYAAGFSVGIPGITVQLPDGSGGQNGGHLGFAPASRLGGPKAPPEDATASAGNGKMDFLREAHRSACRIFGTVLGPEANTAHKNHFHVDMAERKGVTICE